MIFASDCAATPLAHPSPFMKAYIVATAQLCSLKTQMTHLFIFREERLSFYFILKSSIFFSEWISDTIIKLYPAVFFAAMCIPNACMKKPIALCWKD